MNKGVSKGFMLEKLFSKNAEIFLVMKSFCILNKVATADIKKLRTDINTITNNKLHDYFSGSGVTNNYRICPFTIKMAF
jgi:hypothetical protein